MSETREKVKKARARHTFTDSILLKIDKKGKEINKPAYKQIRDAIEVQLNRLLELCKNEKKRWKTLKKYSKEELEQYISTLED